MVPVLAELTTTQAADLLNVSRPHVIKLIDRGELKHKMVGTHRKLLARDVLAYQARVHAMQGEALDAMAAGAERLAEPVGIIATVGDEHGRVGHGGEHQRRALVVADLALGEQQDARPPALVADRVELGVQVAFGAADPSG